MISDIGYGLAAAAYLMLLLLLLTVRKPGLAKYLLIIATASTLAWSVAHLNLISSPMSLAKLLFIDTLKQMVWLLFLAAFLRNDFSTFWDVVKRPVSLAILTLPLLALVLPVVAELSLTWRFLLQTIIALEVLVLLEQVYRQSGHEKWSFKPLVLYLGVLNLFEFVTYANATMVAQVEPLYIAARGYIYLALVPLLVMATRRIKHWGVDIFISREIVLHSSLLLVAGGYLFMMAILGYTIKFIGGSWGPTIQIVLIALSLALLITLFLSNDFRTKVKVFITKNFFANQFDYRIEWVKLTEVLNVEQASLTSTYQAALRGYLGAINYDKGALLKLNADTLEVVAHEKLRTDDIVEKISDAGLIEFFKQTSWILDTDEYCVKPYLYENLKLNDAQQTVLKELILVPIFEHDTFWGIAILGYSDGQQHRLNWELRDYLNAVTAQISGFIFHHEAATEVAENAQFAAFSRMSAFVVHDLKNVLAQIDLILTNAKAHKHNPEFINDTFETLEHTKARMDKMLAQLTEKQQSQTQRSGCVKVSEVINEVVQKRCANAMPKPQLMVDSEQQVVVDAEKLANVMYHLISNAQQATADDGYVMISLSDNPVSRTLVVEIKDNGAGMSKKFIEERLFKPFDTTKGNAGMGIGAYDAKNYMLSINGSISVHSELGHGSTFTLHIPTH